MVWVMTSRRVAGTAGNPPRVDFAVGGIIIAHITMIGVGTGWKFELYYNDEYQCERRTFSEALTQLHSVLNGPAPDGFEIFKGAKVKQ